MIPVMKLSSILGLVLASPLGAQELGNAWLELVENPGSLALPALAVSGAGDEVDFGWGDLDQDGDEDLVVVRKEPLATVGKRTNLLLLNEGGVLVDRTVSHARYSTVPGDNGFLTPTSDRDVQVVDVDLDGWLDVVTAGGIHPGDPKAVGHPRVYRNQGLGAGGAWSGLLHEDARIPQLLHAQSGLPFNPRPCALAAGDVTGDGAPELFLADYDTVTVGVAEDPASDLNDRLLVNDGNGFFTDSTQLLSPNFTELNFGINAVIADLNGDGWADILKGDGIAAFETSAPFDAVYVAYNNLPNPGELLFTEIVHGGFESYHQNVGELNNDGRPDLILSDDQRDRYRYNKGNDALGRVLWGAAKVYVGAGGASVENTWTGNNLAVDLDNDGWQDVITTGVDPEDPQSLTVSSRIYHNPGGVPGQEIELVEEREKLGGGGWVGAVGWTLGDQRGAHDVAVLDLELDGDLDLVVGQGLTAGTRVWINQTVPNHLFWDAYEVSVSAGGTQTLTLDAGDAHAGELYLVLGSLGGTAPGTPTPAGELPLVLDAYFGFLLASPNAPPLANGFGVLDAGGGAVVPFTLPPGTTPSLAGSVVHHAFVAVDPLTGEVTLASGAAPAKLVP